MFNPQRLVTDAFVDHLKHCFRRAFPGEHARFEGVLEQASRTALEALTSCDAAYHDVNHSILVTDVGQTILWGRVTSQGDIGPDDWLHAVVAMLFHDIGYMRGLLKDDRAGEYVSDRDGHRVRAPEGATDAFMSPYHVDRGRLFVEQRFAAEPLLDV